MSSGGGDGESGKGFFNMILPQCFEMVVRGVGSYCGVGRVGKRV